MKCFKTEIENAQQFYTLIRKINPDIAILQKLQNDMDLIVPDANISLYDMSNELKKYHNHARNYERSISELEQKLFLKKQNTLLGDMAT